MTDKELLEVAAKAAGFELTQWPDEDFVRAVLPGNWCPKWNPLGNDGDALRLAVKLGIKFRYNAALGQAFAWIGPDEIEVRENIEDCHRSECAATRRAIVRAAAKIGEDV